MPNINLDEIKKLVDKYNKVKEDGKERIYNKDAIK